MILLMAKKLFLCVFKSIFALLKFIFKISWRLVRAYILVAGDPKYRAQQAKEEADRQYQAEYQRALFDDAPLPVRWNND